MLRQIVNAAQQAAMTRAGFGGVVAGILLILGCSVGTSTGKDSPSRSPESTDAATTTDAMEMLRAGTEFIGETSFRVDTDIAGQVTTRSHVDTVGKRAAITISAAGQAVEIRLIDDEIYLKSEAELPGVGHQWMVLDPTRVPPGFTIGSAPGKNDPGGSARLIDAVVAGIPDASLRHSDFGTAVEVIRPEGAMAAPAALYRQLGLRN